MAATLFLLRHGQTQWSAAGRHTGRTDLELTDEGVTQAIAAGASLAGVHLARVVASPAVRARRTAELAGIHVDVVDPDLWEWDYGTYEGRTTVEIREALADPTWTAWTAPVGPNGLGESCADVGARVDRVIASCMADLAAGRNCLLVAHAHVLRILTARWLGLEPTAGRFFQMEPARLCGLGFEREQPVIHWWNTASPQVVRA